MTNELMPQRQNDAALDSNGASEYIILCLLSHKISTPSRAPVPFEKVFVPCHWCEENEMVFVSNKVPLPATSDQITVTGVKKMKRFFSLTRCHFMALSIK